MMNADFCGTSMDIICWIRGPPLIDSSLLSCVELTQLVPTNQLVFASAINRDDMKRCRLDVIATHDAGI